MAKPVFTDQMHQMRFSADPSAVSLPYIWTKAPDRAERDGEIACGQRCTVYSQQKIAGIRVVGLPEYIGGMDSFDWK
jgi:hypothetical protein